MKKKNTQRTIIFFCVGVVLSVFVIAGLATIAIHCFGSIKDDHIRDAAIATGAALLGGLFTLFGVAWTIVKSDRDRKEDWRRRDKEKIEEERKRLVPYIQISLGKIPTSFVNAELHKKNNECFQEKTWYCFIIKEFNIKNVSNSNILLMGVSLNGKFYEFGSNQLLEQNGICQIQTTRNWEYVGKEPLKNLDLLISDIIGNEYRISCKFSTEFNGVIQEKNEQGEVVNTRYESAHTVESVSIPEYIKGA